LGRCIADTTFRVLLSALAVEGVSVGQPTPLAGLATCVIGMEYDAVVDAQSTLMASGPAVTLSVVPLLPVPLIAREGLPEVSVKATEYWWFDKL
jgi:hypothetical protein